MKYLILSILLSGCQLYAPQKQPMTFHKNDKVVFNYTRETEFYSKACHNTGVVDDFIDYVATGVREYLLTVPCGDDTSLIWVSEKDIVGVIK